MAKVQKRNPILVLIFSIITLGIYAIYWTVMTKIEIKWKNKISSKDIRGLLSFMRRYGVQESFLVSRDTEEKVEREEGIIQILPFWKALLTDFF